MTSADKGLPMTKADLLGRIEREWAALLAEIATFDAQQMLVPDAGGWTVKDNLAHLVAWERAMIDVQFEGQVASEALNIDAATLAKHNIDAENAMLLKRAQARTLPEVLADLHQTHARLLAALDRTPEAALHELTTGSYPEVKPRMEWVVNDTYDHFAEHRQTISRYAKQRLP